MSVQTFSHYARMHAFAAGTYVFFALSAEGTDNFPGFGSDCGQDMTSAAHISSDSHIRAAFSFHKVSVVSGPASSDPRNIEARHGQF